MSRITVIPAALVQTWTKKLIKQHLLSSVWDQLSNQFSVNMPIPMQKSMPMPSAVVMKVTDEFKSGSFRTTMISLIKGGSAPTDGPNILYGKETRATMQEVGLFYNVKRFARPIGDESVEGDVAQYYKIAELTAGLITSDFVEDNDYDHQKATVEGAADNLTSASAWQNSDKGTSINAPLAVVLHPKIYCWISGALTLNVWSATDATARSNLATNVASMASTDTFNMSLVDLICDRAARFVLKLPGMQGEKEISWVCKISNNQWLQLLTSAAAGSVQDRFKYNTAEMDKVVTGYFGVYRNVLWIVDQRSPLCNLTGGNAIAFQYITNLADNRVTVVPTGTVGTFEVAMLYGNGALGMAVKEELNFIKKDSIDYSFEETMAGQKKMGVRRIDLDATDAATSARRNQSSFLVLTSTNALTMIS